MEFFTRSGAASRIRSDCVIIGLFDGGSIEKHFGFRMHLLCAF